jgi:phosphoribosylamine--glycine ligase
MRVLVIGSGGREHALVWKISKSSLVNKIFCAPGNPGISQLAECIPIPASDMTALRDFAQNKKIDLTVVGPEDPLVAGVVDLFSAAGLKIFGPSKVAAQLEGSKEFSKDLMRDNQIPTAEYHTFTNSADAKEYIHSLKKYPIVLKASGLAAGKGVLICLSQDEALRGIEDLMDTKVFGQAGDVIVIEEFLEGEEVSIFAITDGKSFCLLSTAQDHKKALDGDRGKNTGGMGAYAPAPFADDAFLETVSHKIIAPTLRAMETKGSPYKGLLYVGLIITSEGPRVLEYNVRFGDPETEVVLPLLESDLVELMLASVENTIANQTVRLKSGFSFDVVLTSGGYPGSYEKSRIIKGLDQLNENILLFHAGTAKQNDSIVTAGGRVLNVVAVEPTFDEARSRVYENIKQIHFDQMYYRSDIGFRAKKYFTT